MCSRTVPRVDVAMGRPAMPRYWPESVTFARCATLPRSYRDALRLSGNLRPQSRRSGSSPAVSRPGRRSAVLDPASRDSRIINLPTTARAASREGGQSSHDAPLCREPAPGASFGASLNQTCLRIDGVPPSVYRASRSRHRATPSKPLACRNIVQSHHSAVSSELRRPAIERSAGPSRRLSLPRTRHRQLPGTSSPPRTSKARSAHTSSLAVPAVACGADHRVHWPPAAVIPARSWNTTFVGLGARVRLRSRRLAWSSEASPRLRARPGTRRSLQHREARCGRYSSSLSNTAGVTRRRSRGGAPRRLTLAVQPLPQFFPDLNPERNDHVLPTVVPGAGFQDCAGFRDTANQRLHRRLPRLAKVHGNAVARR